MRWFFRYGYNHEKASYRRDETHKKKVLSDDEFKRREWRQKKKMRKDNSKPSYRRGAGKWYKQYSNTLHRQWERQMIHAEKWDDMSEKDYKFFLDPWMWD